MGQTDAAVEGIIYLLVVLTSVTFVSLLSIDLWERFGGRGHGWRAYRHREEVIRERNELKTKSSKALAPQSDGSSSADGDVNADLEDAPPALSRGDGSMRKFLPSAVENFEPSRIRAFLRGLIIFWSVLGLGLAVFLLVNFAEYVQDENLLQDQFAELARQDARDAVSSSSGGGGSGGNGGGSTLGSSRNNTLDAREESEDSGIVTIDSDGNITGSGFSLFSDTFIIPAPLAEAVLTLAFRDVAPDDEGELYGIKWIKQRCERTNGNACLNTMEMLALAGSTPAFEVFWVAAPTGTNPAILFMLVIALFLDMITFLAFGTLVMLRTRTSMREGGCCRRSAMCFEIFLLVVSVGILIFLVIGALSVPIAYDGIAFVSPFGQKGIALPLRVSGERAETEAGTSDYIFNLDLTQVPTLDWCLTLPELARANLTFGYVPGVTESALLTGTTAPVPSQPLCRRVGGGQTTKTLSEASYWSPIIDFVREQVLEQGAAVDGLLLLMDGLALAASYMFLII